MAGWQSWALPLLVAGLETLYNYAIRVLRDAITMSQTVQKPD